ncbi:MAG: HD-GYP domain-containing protein, partial [Actinomycetota bacterium]
GYHRGASGGAIPSPARVLAAADAFVAMTEERAHRPVMPPDAAARELEGEASAGRLDPDAVRAVLRAFDRPVLLVKGTVSTEWLRAIVDILGEHYPRATVIDLPGSHACHIESIDAFLEALEAHLESAEPVASKG